MAEEADDATGGGGLGEDVVDEPAVKCEECVPGLPAWMATFSDLVTLLLTFFVLLLSFAKTESAKYEAALGSIRNAFGGNVLKHGEVIQRGKSPDDSPTMIESQQPIKPFPIDFLTMEGLLDKREINRESDETLKQARESLAEFDLAENADVYEMSEGIKVVIKDKIYFEKGSIEIKDLNVEVYKKILKLMATNKWTIFVMGHASRGEVGPGGLDAFDLSSRRAAAAAKSLRTRGVPAEKVTTMFFGDTRPDVVLGGKATEDPTKNRRVEFMIRKRDVSTLGHKVESR
jgi:chemotaxis protein MotB